MKIIFREGDENRIVVEQNSELSIFQAQYTLAHSIFNRLKKDKKTRNDNNIIAFCGDRGSGKTSCMESFIEQLKKEDEQTINKEYYALNTIDPSFFDDTHNILELVLGDMYNQIKQDKSINKKEHMNEHRDYDIETLLMQFNDAMYYMKYLANSQNREKYYDPLEELDSLGAGLRLQNIISKLFAEFLKYYNRKYIILSIDDLDLNIQGVYSMLEYIRKYFTNEHCIILISVKVDQLVDAIKIHLNKTQHVPIDDSYMMAVKYVNKIIPAGNRVNMPELEDYCDSELEYITISEQHNIYHSVKEAVTHTIFWKTGYLFYNSKGHSSWIVPRNLRSLRQLLHLLFTMPDIYEEDKDQDKNNGDKNKDNSKNKNKDKHHTNQALFKNYFYHVWSQQLNDNYRNRIQWILRNDNNLTFNKFVITQLSSLPQFELDKNKFKDLFDPSNYSYNISLGEVMNVLEYVGRNETDIQLQLFLFFIRSLYSIKLYESYDSITDADNIENVLFPEGDKNPAEIYASDAMFEKTNALQSLVNGLYFSYEQDEVLPPTKDDYHRDVLLINGDILLEKIKQFPREEEAIDETYKKQFRLIEYFLLCISRRVQLKNPDSRNWFKRRNSPDPVHITGFNIGVKNLVFDVLAPFYNILNLKNTYDRFNASFMHGQEGETLFEFAKKHEWTLLNKMLSKDNTYRDFDNEYHRLLSDGVIRNAEVLVAISERLKAQRYTKSYSSPETHKYLAEFYKNIINSSMRTYPQQPDEEAYTIQFNFLNTLNEVLTSCDTDLFNTIMKRKLVNDKNDLNTIFRNKTYKSYTILKNIRTNFKEVYETRRASEWNNLFGEGDIPREEIIKKLEAILEEVK